MRNLKILVISVNPSDATSYYRCWGVLPNIDGIDFIPYESSFMNVSGQRVFSWASALQFDGIFIQRGFGKEVLELARYCKNCGLKIIYELDDNLWEIPENYKIKSFFPPSALQTMEEIIKISDLTIVSTKGLQEYISNITDIEPIVIENTLNYPIQDFNENGPIIWRGSNTHIEDLREFKEEIVELSKDNEIQFWGHNPIELAPYLPIVNYKFVPPLDPIMYFKYLREVKPKAIIVPLLEIEFNRAKSNIAYLEATMSGAVCISNQYGEFKDKGIKFGENPTIQDHSRAKEDIWLRYDYNRSVEDRGKAIRGIWGV